MSVIALIVFLMPPHPDLVKEHPEIVKYAKNKRELGIDAPSSGFYNIRSKITVLKKTQDSLMIPVVLIDYPDYPYKFADTLFQKMMFGQWPGGSARDFYIENSYGQFAINGTAYGWVTSDSNKSYYGVSNGFQRAAILAKEAAQKADASIDFSQFDNDKDGYVDIFSVIHAGYGYEETGDGSDIWSHKWSFNSAGIGEYITNDYDPVTGLYTKVNVYTIQPEKSRYFSPYTGIDSIVSIGVFVHEWGHGLGLPDLYDTDGSGSGLGVWSVMAGGAWGGDGRSPWKPSHFDPWSKEWLGWITPVVINSNRFDTLFPVEDTALVFKLWTDGQPDTEYFLIEFRDKRKFDTTLVGKGMLIYHVDWDIINANWWSNTVNADSIYGVALEQADGNDDLFNGVNWGDTGDPYPGSTGNTAFDSTGTIPDSRSNSGINTHCGVNQITWLDIAQTKISGFLYINATDVKENVNKENETKLFFVSSKLFIFAPDNKKVNLNLLDVSGRKVLNISETLKTGMNLFDLKLKKGTYFLILRENGKEQIFKFTLIR